MISILESNTSNPPDCIQTTCFADTTIAGTCQAITDLVTEFFRHAGIHTCTPTDAQFHPNRTLFQRGMYPLESQMTSHSQEIRPTCPHHTRLRTWNGWIGSKCIHVYRKPHPETAQFTLINLCTLQAKLALTTLTGS